MLRNVNLASSSSLRDLLLPLDFSSSTFPLFGCPLPVWSKTNTSFRAQLTPSSHLAIPLPYSAPYRENLTHQSTSLNTPPMLVRVPILHQVSGNQDLTGWEFGV